MALFELEFENDEPIEDELMVLDLLYTDRWECKIDRRLYLRTRLRNQSYVRIDGYGVKDYLVANGIGERLLGRWLVEGKKHWGYTDNCDLTISDYGRELVRKTYAAIGVPYDDKFISRLRTERWFCESVRKPSLEKTG